MGAGGLIGHGVFLTVILLQDLDLNAGMQPGYQQSGWISIECCDLNVVDQPHPAQQ
jgi:hypothetical protein